MNVKLSRLNRILKKDGFGIAIIPIDLQKKKVVKMKIRYLGTVGKMDN